jgi:hypothetical protein
MRIRLQGFKRNRNQGKKSDNQRISYSSSKDNRKSITARVKRLKLFRF